MLKNFTLNGANLKNDVLSGLTVALALVPEAVAFAFVAGVDPLVGLYAAFLVGLITAAIGGRPGMISGATGALAVVMVSLVADHGVEYLFATVVLMGVIQVLAGVLRLGKFVRLIPHPVMLGFVNGLAIVIFLAQKGQFMVGPKGAEEWMTGMPLFLMLGLVALTMAIIHFLPKLTKAIPSSLAAIVIVSLIVIFGGLETRTVGDLAKISGSFPEFHFPTVPLNWETFQIILPYSVILAAIGLIESLMTLSLVDEVTETHGNSNRECVAQGTANIVTGFFGGMGGCAMIGQSMINVNSGGRGRASGISAALFLLIFILFAGSLIEMIPIAALTGVMFMVVIGTFAWSSFRILHKIPVTDAFVLILVSGLTVAFDLAIAVAAGIVVSALVFAWENATRIRARKREEKGVKYYEIFGPLFFGSVKAFNEKFDPKNDPQIVVVDFIESRVCDHSGLDAINKLAERYEREGKELHLRHLSSDCRRLLSKAGKLVDVNVIEDPEYQVALDSKPI
ncbi:sodium-independent anion transporter [Fulvitalea axinellae]|uniref:Sodium-independent anion transporter n=1 Tax=Fulvitalea axinellae TaxID=1182444 RepID=A0AAU9CJJ5_9BACT|nr:sodium-independent anion transporter [Fulvitalea axinellae]